MKTNWKLWSISTAFALLITGFIIYTGNPTTSISGRSASSPVTTQPIFTDSLLNSPAQITQGKPVTPTLSPALRDLPVLDLSELDPLLEREVNPRLSLNTPVDVEVVESMDPLLGIQRAAVPSADLRAFDTPTLNFAGNGFTGANPPDTVGEVGPNHYVQAVNGGGTTLRIFDKSGNLVSGPTSMDGLGSGDCANGLGDPIILYDRLADRWLFSEFSSTSNDLCVYISQTNDPTGAFFAYNFTAPNFPDYPKYAVWSDAYYVTSNEGGPSPVYALDRENMITGGIARPFQRLTAPSLAAFGFQALTPADLDGALAPPADSPGIMMRHRDDEAHNAGSNNASQDFLEIWTFDVDWDTPGNSSLSKLIDIPMSEISSELCGFVSFECIDQPDSVTNLDPLREVIMWRLQYRNFGSYEVLVGNLTTDVDGNDTGGIRWFELRRTGAGTWVLHQEGTYAPDGDSRWMGAIAMDGSGNIAVAYNVSSDTTYPSLRYAGRLATDTAGTLPQGEYTIATGTAPNGSNRYGDYSAMSVDPADDCTFWFTGMYNPATQWNTQIATFKFDSCTGSTGDTGTLNGQVTDSSTGQPITNAEIGVTNGVTFTTSAVSDGNGDYSLAAPTGTYTLTAQIYGYQPVSITNITIANNMTTTQDIQLTAVTSYTIEGVVTDADTGWPLYAQLQISGDPVDPPTTSLWNDPLTGYYSVTLSAAVTYTIEADAWVAGYETATQIVPPLTGDATVDLALTADTTSCTAPGYTPAPCTAPADGGLVIGTVTDDNNNQILAGATITSGVDSATTDGDGFFTLYAPSGTATVTATVNTAGYGPDVDLVPITDGGTVRNDFAVPAGLLEEYPTMLEANLQLGDVLTTVMPLTNLGNFALDYDIRESNGGFVTQTLALANRQAMLNMNKSVLLLTPNNDISDLANALSVYPDLTVTTYFTGDLSTITGTELEPYDVVITTNRNAWPNREGVGDALADYVDAGGKVILNSYAYDYFGWEITGRFMDEQYGPFTQTSSDFFGSSNLGTIETHPIMQNVITITNGYFWQNPGLAAGATAIAYWEDGNLMAAVNDDVLAINMLPSDGNGSAGWEGDYDTMLHNAINYFAPEPIPWLIIDPITGTITSDSQADIDLIYDTTVLTQTGRYTGTLGVQSSDPYNTRFDVPVTLNVGSSFASTELDVFISLDGSCLTDDGFEVVANREFAYCFTLTNNSAMTLTTHSLNDTVLGSLFTDLDLQLGPGQSETVSQLATVSATTDSQIIWIGSDGQSLIISDTFITVTPIYQSYIPLAYRQEN